MSQDYTEGYDDGRKDGFEAGFRDAGKTIGALEDSLRAALTIVRAYGDYIPMEHVFVKAEEEGYDKDLALRCLKAMEALKEYL
jgi:hypothetical protein